MLKLIIIMMKMFIEINGLVGRSGINSKSFLDWAPSQVNPKHSRAVRNALFISRHKKVLEQRKLLGGWVGGESDGAL